ncbi:hypothetical protein [Streptomyces noursei]|uniref:Uncharacterized protein n=1 Tax=Streptomyces noursei TaxID=1971 RepID=A0A401R1C3_STRNR|nr:hypothetical protein [Streptomyces noursei]EPY92871.1 hypothetical protein K530_51020 [Streptomyces noursei CCRC 11814]UWS72511.1 hypothetical protein N1H47_15360 [Streptomyces noursei]GCB91445.1 hypothetical protein SALB_04174 [Streptomyces noursei]
MKPLLWLLLLAALAFNLLSYALWDGSFQALMSVGSGLLCLAAAGGLWVLRGRGAVARS